MFCIPTNSVSKYGSPSSINLRITSVKLLCNSSSVFPCEYAPVNHGTYPTISSYQDIFQQQQYMFS